MAQTVQILRASPPATLLPGVLSVELGAVTKLWVGSGTGNRLLLSSDPVDVPVISTAFVKITGSTMTGFLTLSGPPTANLHAATKAYVDAGDTTTLNSAKAYADAGDTTTLNAAKAYALAQDNAIKAAYLPLVGGTLTGSLTISVAWAALNLTKPASGTSTFLVGSTGANARWALHLGDNAAEGGGNSGSNFQLVRYNDAGSAIDAPLAIIRSTGAVSINGQTGPFLPLAGGTMTGSLTVNGSIAAGLDVTAGRNMSVAGTLFGGNISGAALTMSSATINGGLNVTGVLTGAAANFSSNVSVNGEITVTAIQFPNYGMTAPATNIGFGYDYAGGYLWVVPNGAYVGFLGPVQSDERLKRDIRPITVDPLAALCRVQLKAFNQVSTRNEPADGMRAHDVGFIAQQLREVIPDAVIEPPMEDAFLGLDLMPLVAYCVGAIQQLEERLHELEEAVPV